MATSDNDCGILLINEVKLTFPMANEVVEPQDKLSIEPICELVRKEVKGENYHDRRHLIHRVHRRLRVQNVKSYIPRVVSIGPMHYGDKDLKGMESRKGNYMENLLEGVLLACLRKENPQQYETLMKLSMENPQEYKTIMKENPQKDEILKECVKMVNDKIGEIKSSYDSQVMTNINDSQLVKMMVIDGCFILEFSFEIYRTRHWGNYQVVRSTCYDLMLLENQIPFFVLQDLFACTIKKINEHITIFDLLRPVLHLVNCIGEYLPSITFESAPIHILDLLNRYYKIDKGSSELSRDSNSTMIKKEEETTKQTTKRSAIELDKAGVKFKPMPYGDLFRERPLEIKVEVPRVPCCSLSNATIKMGVLKIHDFTELFFRNLIAYEQSKQSDYFVTSYAMVLDILIDTQEDIAKLVDEGVVYNTLSSNQEAANMVNRLCKDIAYVRFCYNEEWSKLDKKNDRGCPKNMAWLKRTYFNNPWNIIAFIAGILLFVLTVAQTYFTIRPVGSK